jgi:hypothetical protein
MKFIDNAVIALTHTQRPCSVHNCTLPSTKHDLAGGRAKGEYRECTSDGMVARTAFVSVWSVSSSQRSSSLPPGQSACCMDVISRGGIQRGQFGEEQLTYEQQPGRL